MGILTAIELQLEELNLTKDMLRNQLIGVIDKLPDNPEIKRITHDAYTINSSELFKDCCMRFDPFYYDYKTQYKVICDIIKEDSDFLEVLKSIIKIGAIKRRGTIYMFNPAVIAHIETLL